MELMPNDMRKFSITVLIFFTLYIYRTQLFNILIKYEPEQIIELNELNDPFWMGKVDNIIFSNSYVGIVELNDMILKVIAQNLEFGKMQKTDNPNNFRESSVAHCIGYSALNASMLNYACKKMNSKIYQIEHVRGNIKLFGFKITSKKNSGFYKDHDFVRIENKQIDKYYFSDATIYEFFKINRINLNYGM